MRQKIALGAGFIVGIGLLVFCFHPNSPPPVTQSEITPFSPTPSNSAQTNPVGSVPNQPGAPSDPANPQSEDLKKTLQEIRPRLATLDSIQGLKAEEVHGTPPAVLEAGAALGDLEEYLERRPEEYRSATPFWAECASNAKLFPAVRAFCLHSLRKKPSEWASGVSDQVKALPQEIISLEADL